jgi:hypothetical protein
MLDVIANTECEALYEQIKSSLVFAIQLDGNADRRMLDNKFTSIRCVTGPPVFKLHGILEGVTA